MVDTVITVGLPAIFCPIYEPRYPDATSRRVAGAALSMIDHCIVRMVAGRGFPILELRSVCSEAADFARPIEPSVQGCGKIADAIPRVFMNHDFASARAEIITR